MRIKIFAALLNFFHYGKAILFENWQLRVTCSCVAIIAQLGRIKISLFSFG